MEKILTVVIPAYNMQDYLSRCLDSLIVDHDLMTKFEVLVINDGSKDNTSIIAHKYQDRFAETFRVIDKENGNYGSCINIGLSEARGKYIKILDADDWFDNNSFALYMKFLVNLKVDVDMIITSYNRRYANNNSSELISPVNVLYNHVYSFSDFDFENNGCRSMLVMHSITYRTELLKSNGYFQDTGISFTDMEYDMIPMLYVNKFIFADFSLYQYYLGREGQTVSLEVSSKSLKAYLKIFNTLSPIYLKIKATKEPVRLNNARVVLFNLLSALFFVALCFERKTKSLDDKLHEIEHFIIRNDLVLLYKLRRIRPYKLPVFLIWEKTGCFCSNETLHKFITVLKNISNKI